MSRVMYVECFSGAAGDMLLGALLDAGLPLDALQRALGSLGVHHELRVGRVLRCGVSATKFDVLEHGQLPERAPHPEGGEPHRHADDHRDGHDHADGHRHEHVHTGGHRTLKEISHLIAHSALSASAQATAIALFHRMGEAEAAIHSMSLDEVYLHEVGALDSIVDIVGTVFAMEWFGVDDIEASPLNVGGGFVDIAHGRFPVPTPATLRLLQGVPIYSEGPGVELVTPTGALLVSAYARHYGPMPAMAVERIGYGAGTRDTPHSPNVVRVVVGQRVDRQAVAPATNVVWKVECEIDDMNPQLFAPATELLFGAGALDVVLTPVLMKKGRPGTRLTVLAPTEARTAVTDIVFRETTTIGVRVEAVAREVLDRHWDDVHTAGGLVRVKVASRNGIVMNVLPEFEDCLRAAQASGMSVKAVQAEALHRWSARQA